MLNVESRNLVDVEILFKMISEIQAVLFVYIIFQTHSTIEVIYVYINKSNFLTILGVMTSCNDVHL